VGGTPDRGGSYGKATFESKTGIGRLRIMGIHVLIGGPIQDVYYNTRSKKRV